MTIFLLVLSIGVSTGASSWSNPSNKELAADAVRLGKLASKENLNGHTRDLALTHINQALKLNPKLDWLWYEKADILLKMEEDAEGLKCIAEAIRLSPRNSTFWYLQAYLYRYSGKKEEALASADQSLKLAPDNVDALGVRGRILFDLKRFAEAEAVYDKLIKLTPRSGIITHAQRMLVCKELHKWKKVIEDADYCLGCESGKILATFNLLLARAEAREQLKHYAKAVDDCHAALRLFKDDREPHKRLIRLYTLMGDKKRAAEETIALREIDEDMSPPAR